MLRPPALSLEDAVHQARLSLQEPVALHALHEAVDHLMRALHHHLRIEPDVLPAFCGQNAEFSMRRQSSMLDQLTEVCFDLMFDEQRSARRLARFLDEHFGHDGPEIAL
jgi:hypothetical protein